MENKFGAFAITATALTILIGGYVLVRETAGKINSNRDLLDTEKSFNMAVEETQNTVSLMKIRSYTDYRGEAVEIVNEDNLRILTSIVNTTLSNYNNYKTAYENAKMIADDNPVISYDELQNNGTDLEYTGWNKALYNFDYNFDKAITFDKDGNIMVYDIESWKDWENDDKVQIILKDHNVILSHFRNMRLVDTRNAEKGAFENYLLSLVGDPVKIDTFTVYPDEISRPNKVKKYSKTDAYYLED
jgi:hypothetical protein